MYTAELIEIIEKYGLRVHLYADDTQVYGFCPPSDVAGLTNRLSACIDEIRCWMTSNRLQLNTDKTEVLWFSTAKRQHQLPTIEVRIGTDPVAPSSAVRDLGVFLDGDLSMRTHVQRTVAGCFAVLRQLRSVRRSVPTSTYQTLIVSLVLSKLDYGNATLAGIPAYQLGRLQSVMNAAARSIVGIRRSDHITPVLVNLHWLKAPERIKFKLAVLTYRCLHGIAPPYLCRDIQRVADLPSRRRLRSSSTNHLVVCPTRLSTVGDRAFASAAPRIWNSLPDSVTSAPSLQLFQRQLKTVLFKQSFHAF